ncbi:MAG: HNH endonuclease signature motif containing protein, partial [Cyanobacteria bacterium P01_F01_bin.4]
MPSISKALRQQVFIRAKNCCEYCKTQQLLIGMPLIIDHVIPISADGKNEFENLAAACYRCNEFKGPRVSAIDPLSSKAVPLFNPRSQGWSEHFAWAEEGVYITGKTATGRATVAALRLNNKYVTESRKIWIAE